MEGLAHESVRKWHTVTRRTHVYFSDQAWATLTDMSARSGSSMSEVLRKSLSTYRWFLQTRAQGNRVLVERPDGSLREVLSLD